MERFCIEQGVDNLLVEVVKGEEKAGCADVAY